MAENKTKPTTVSVAAFIDNIADRTKRADAKALVKKMRGVTGEPPKMWGPSIIGFGTCHYKYDSGREGDKPVAGFSPRKPATVIYILTGGDGVDALLAKPGKHNSGKSCLYIKKSLKEVADVDQVVLKTLVVKSIAETRLRYAS